MTPGIHALLSLDGAPLQPDDLRALGLDEPAAYPQLAGTDFAIAAVDREPDAVHVLQLRDNVVAFAGYLDEPEDLAAALGVSAEAPVAELAVAAQVRYGAEASVRMLGNWSLLQWDLRARELTLLTSEMWRDAMYFATDGNRVAVAPNMLQLCSLPWVGRTLDPEGFALNVSRAGLRKSRGDRTVWKGVRRVVPAVHEVFSRTGRTSIPAVAVAPPELWRGSFEDAVDALNVLGRRIVGQHLRRSGQTAFLLSGGLDSTLLCSLGAQERGPDAAMFCLSSVAPQGSGVPDEREFSAAVASQLGLEQQLIAPDQQADPYRPSPTVFAHVQQPMLPLRHYLYLALWQAASRRGAHALVDGVSGELSITHKPALGSDLWWLRRWRFNAILWNTDRRARGTWPQQAFHVRLSPQLLAAVPRDWKPSWQTGPEKPARRVPGQPVGMHPAVRKNADGHSHAPFGLRHQTPFLDQRLLRLAASFPAEFFNHGGDTRALARAMLRGRVPEFVRTRRSSLPFSPDYRRRLKEQAQQASLRLDAFRQAGAGEWIDLDWLGKALRAIGGAGENEFLEAQAQLTSAAAEFFCWLQA
jgi:asparagine synthase (glutamine-hydrolysing)